MNTNPTTFWDVLYVLAVGFAIIGFCYGWPKFLTINKTVNHYHGTEDTKE